MVCRHLLICLLLAITAVIGKSRFINNAFFRIRGGNSVNGEDETSNNSIEGGSTLVVSTALGSAFLDKKKKIILSKNASIAELKVYIKQKFPGSPPMKLQRLYFGTRLLADTEIVSNITFLPTTPLLLDMVSGYSVYNKTMSIMQALEAYVSCNVQLAYLSSQLTSLATGNTQEMPMQSPGLRYLYQTLNESIFSVYGAEIAAAREAEQDPEMQAQDTLAWRDVDRKPASPIAAALAKEFDLNLRGVAGFTYMSFLILVSVAGMPALTGIS
jgi:hypothetical protein